MHPPQDHPVRSASAAGARLQRLYDTYGGPARNTLMQTFGVPEDEANVMVKHVLRAVMTTGVADDEAWIAAAVAREGRQYQRRSGFEAKAPPNASAAEQAALEHAAYLREALPSLVGPAQEALRLRFLEGRTYAAIAEEMGVSTPYVKRLVLGSLRTLMARLRERG